MTEELRRQARDVFEAGLAAAEPMRLFESVELPEPEAPGRLFVYGAGKAAAHLAAAVAAKLEGRDYRGRVIVKHGHGVALDRIVVDEGGHPLPDEAGLAATERLLSELGALTAADRVLFLLTGGASALLVAPAEGLSLSDKIGVTDLLLRSGATIQELNAVRKHLSAVKGGRLLERMAPARVSTFLISDVIGDDLSSIGSGPTAPDPSTFQQAYEVLSAYGVWERAPERVRRHLERGMALEIPETPKPGDTLLDGVEHRLLASNRHSLEAASRKARELGFAVEVFAEDVVGDVHEQATRFAARVIELGELSELGERGGRGYALLAGGELTLAVHGDGAGGRSQEFALVAARELAGVDGAVVLAAGTDGTDGPTDAAGAFADGRSWDRGRALGVEPESCLSNNDSYHFFEAVGGLLKTGPTGTNVNDLMVGLIAH